MITIGLLWHSLTSSNLGVGALTLSQMALIKEIAEENNLTIKFKIFGTIGNENYNQTEDVLTTLGVERNFIAPWKSGFIKEIKSCDIVLDIGEGDSFTDIYGKERFFMMVGTKILVKLLRKPLLLSPQTIGPFNSFLTKKLSNLAMRMSDHVFVRDHMSSQYLVNQNIKNYTEVIDVAFALPYKQGTPDNIDKVRVGINVSGLLYSGGYTKDNQFGLSLDYKQLTHDLIEYFNGLENCELFLVPHVIPKNMPVEDDYHVSQELQKTYPKIKLAPRFKNPIEAKSFISSMDFFTGARMHACIAAFSSGVPVVPLAYSRKFNGLFESLNYPYFGDCKKDSNEMIVRKVIDSYQNRLAIKYELDDANNLAKYKLKNYTNILRQIINNVTFKKS